ncbi:MAG: LPS export ABC transporter permease LptG, partial [Pseudomonadota bacterium]|nr:LPS export ABC transporter permease LptG [Pseudomonadota bacterium]
MNFFPSRVVAIYMARMFVVRTFAVMAGLVLVLQALDLLGQSGNILA